MLGLWKLRYEATALWGTATQHLLDLLFTFTKRKPALIRFPCRILEVLLVKMFRSLTILIFERFIAYTLLLE